MVVQRRDRRAEYLKKWFNKAEREKDVFDRFMSGWLALVIAAKIDWTNSGLSVRDNTDRELAIEYFKHHAESVAEVVLTNRVGARSLAMRMGTGGGVIVDGQQIQEHCRKFRGKVLGQRDCSATDFAVATAEILNKVRNNLFHGAKVYDDAEDRKLLELVTPLLLAIVSTIESLSRERQEPATQRG